MIDGCGVDVGFPLCITLVNRPHMRDKMDTEADVKACIRREADIIKIHGDLNAYYEHFRNRRTNLIARGLWDVEAATAKQFNNRAARCGALGKLTGDDIRAVYAKYGRACLSCGSTDDVVLDHVRPMSQLGFNGTVNLQPLCRGCNSAKRSKTIDFR